MEEQKVKNPVDIIAAFNRVLGNPAKNHYNLGVTKGKRNKDKKVAAAVAQGGTATPNYNNAHIKGLNALGKFVFPDEAYAAQRTWLQLTVCKLLDMTLCAFVARMETINGYLTAFPTLPGQPAAMLLEMELKELLWRAIPCKWQIRLQDKRIKQHAITCNKFIAKIETIQAVKMQQRILDKRGRRPNPS